MTFYADLHVHSKYSRATSRHADLEHLAIWARKKGLSVVATGDFTHPAWFEELSEKLVPAEPGLYRLRPEIEREVDRRLPPACRGPVRFLLEVEISTIYKKGEKTRKVHHLIYAAHFETAARFRERLGAIGNIASDGRPILGLDSRDLLEITLQSGDDAYLVPAHIWTPWFAAMGSKSGFDSIDDCYGDLAHHIFAVETGLSSDPPMNWRVSGLDRFTLVSNSDAHSPPMLAREATVFETELDYFAIRQALETGRGFGGTVEFFPEEGKYHLDGHRSCGVVLEPEQTRREQGRCPQCGKPLTVGVMHRIEALADRAEGEGGTDRAPFHSLVPLPEVLSELSGVGPKSKTVARRLDDLVGHFGPELSILEAEPVEVLDRKDPLLGEAVRRLREGKVRRQPGFDGEFGVIRLFEEGEIERRSMVAPLFEMAPVERRPPTAVRRDEPKRAAAPTENGPLAPTAPPLEPAAETSGPTGSPEATADATNAESPILAALDAEQRRAASVVDRALLVIAGPGTGKTRTLTHRLAYRIAEGGLDPGHCLAVTFTRRAAREMKERLQKLIPSGADRILVTTFHGLALRILREHGGEAGAALRIADGPARLEVVRALGAADAADARTWLSEIRLRRRELAMPEAGTEARPELDRRLARFEDALEERGLCDFDGLLVRAARLLEDDPDLRYRLRGRYRSISVDEYQDIDALQYRLLRLLAPAGSDLCAIGDPDQSIYRFRGAEVAFFLRFRDDHPDAQVVELSRNYRSVPVIVRAAVEAVAPRSLIPGRELVPMRAPTDDRVTVHAAASPRAEAEYVAHTIERLLGGTSYFSVDSGRVSGYEGREVSFGDFAVLYRTRAQGAPVAEALARAGIPFQQRTHDPLSDHPGVASLLASLEAGELEGERPIEAWLAERVAATEDKEALPDLAAGAELLAPLARRCGRDLDSFLGEVQLGAGPDALDPRAEHVSLLTLHAAKGLEFPVVFLVGCEDGLLPMAWHRRPGSEQPPAATDEPGGDVRPDEGVDEERRLFFVGVTRAESLLHLCWCERRARADGSADRQPSPFLADLTPELLVRSAREHRARKASQLSLF